MSARYTRTISLDVSDRIGVRSVSSVSLPGRAWCVLARSSDSESMSMPASRDWLRRSSNDAEVAGGSTVSISSRSRYPFSSPTTMSWRMVSASSPADTEARSAREDILLRVMLAPSRRQPRHVPGPGRGLMESIRHRE